MQLGQYISSVCFKGRLSESSYLNNIPAVKHLKNMQKLEFTKNVTFIVGENGTGKSTLIEAIAVAFGFNAEGGSKNFMFSTKASHSELYRHIGITKGKIARDGFFLRAESFYNVATNIEEMDKEPASAPPIIDSYGGVSLHEQSHGESFLTLVKERFGGNGVYILDEPEAALSPMRLLTLIIELDRLSKNNSQLIIATHSPILMAFPNAEILELSQEGIRSVDYRQTEHYQLTKQFINDPERMLNYLLK